MDLDKWADQLSDPRKCLILFKTYFVSNKFHPLVDEAINSYFSNVIYHKL
jgi:hypothetical protein